MVRPNTKTRQIQTRHPVKTVRSIKVLNLGNLLQTVKLQTRRPRRSNESRAVFQKYCQCHECRHAVVTSHDPPTFCSRSRQTVYRQPNSVRFLRATAYAIARICHANSVHLSVRLSVTRVYCIKTAERIIEILSLSDMPIILVFCHQGSLGRLILRVSPPTGAPNTRGQRFSTNTRLYLGNGKRQRHSYYGRRI